MIDGSTCAARDGLVQMANVVQVDETVSPRELNHFNRVRSATLAANLAPGVTLGQALTDLDRIARAVAAGGHPHRPGGRVARVRRVERRPLLPVRDRAGVHLPGAGGPVRELRPPAHHPVLGAARGVRGAGHAVRVPDVAQHLLPDRPDHADRAGDQERDPDRRVREPATRTRRWNSTRPWSAPR